MPAALSWSLVVATYNRRHILGRCLDLAARQTRPPLEIIVVDASPDWEKSRESILTGLAGQHPGIRWEYVAAQRRSSTGQRNQGVALARADILFLIDDDSLMYPDCAEQVLRLYEADTEGAVVGVMASEAGSPPDVPKASSDPAPKPGRGPLATLRRWKDRALHWLGVQSYLLPYEEPRPFPPLPESLRSMRTFAIPSLYGAYMTFRRRVLEAEPFDEVLDAYAYLEDCDVSYRAARHGLLLMAQNARLCHLQDPSGRLSPFTLATLASTNALVLHRLNGVDQRGSMKLYRSFLRKQLVIQGLRDLSKRRWSLPQARGVLQAMGLFKQVFASSPEHLRAWYPQFQADLIGRDPGSGRRRIGYLVPEFPAQTHAFFWREVVAWREAGVVVSLLSSRRPEPGACRHAFAEGAARETYYLFPPHLPRALGALLVRPFGSVRAVGYVLGLHESPWQRRLRNLGLVLCAGDLVGHSREHGYGHVHVHSCADTAHVAALAKILGGPTYSLTLHGDLPVYGADHASKMARATFVACVTAPLRRQVLEQVGLPEDRTGVLWMGVDTRAFQDAAAGRSFEPGRLHLVTVARLNAAKGHRHALAAMRSGVNQGLDLRYTIAGEGPHRAEIEADIARLGLGDRVTMAGTVSEEGIRDLLARADAFVLPSVGLGEAAPVSVMEAMACGLPVISSIIGGTPDMITHGVDGLLVAQGDETSLADAMTLLARDPAERRRLGRAARDRAVRCFDSRQTAMRLLEAITGPKSK
jgi:glycosyltransferase involved in cell wall biosynthesis/GT2 family glycosyltransferase